MPNPVNASTPTARAASRRVRPGWIRLAAAGGILAAVAGGIVAVSSMSKPAGATDVEARDVHTVGRTTFTMSITANGELEAKRQTEVRSKLEVRTQVVEVVPEGTRVKKGDLLVKLASDEIETNVQEELLRVETARSDLTAAENNFLIQVNENEANERQTRLKLELAQIELDKFLQGEDKKKLDELTVNLELAKSEATIKREQLDQSRRLFEKGFESKDKLQAAEQAVERADAEVKKSELEQWLYTEFERNKQLKKLSSDVQEAEAEIERVVRKNESQLASKEADRINRRRQLQIREEKLAKLQEQLSNTTITAPTDGLVVYGSNTVRGRGMMFSSGGGPIQVGREIQPNELIMVLPETGQMAASVRVHESLAGRLRPGQKATIKVDALANQVFTATVESISVLAESDNWRDPNLREYTVKVDIDQTNDISRLKPAMRAEAEIVLGAVEDAMAVPIQSIFRDGGVNFVYVPEGSRFVKRPVLLGRRSALYAEVLPLPEELASKHGLKPLAEGERILLRSPEMGEAQLAKFDEGMVADFAAASGRGRRGGMPAGMAGAAPGGGRPAAAAQGGAPGGRPAGGEQAAAPGTDEKAPAADAKPAEDGPRTIRMAAPGDAEPQPAAKPADAGGMKAAGASKE